MTDDPYGLYFRNEDGFREDFNRFNALFGEYRWQTTDARKNHQDEFGNPIQEGETYFSRDMGPSWTDKAKLSRRSMEILLRCVMWSNPRAEMVAEELKKVDQDRLRQATERVWAFMKPGPGPSGSEPKPSGSTSKPSKNGKKSRV